MSRAAVRIVRWTFAAATVCSLVILRVWLAKVGE